MLRQLLSGFRGRKLQAYQVSQWRRVRLSNTSIADSRTISGACTCLFTIAEDAVEYMIPREAGALVAILCQTVEVMIFILSRDPLVTEINDLCQEFKEHIAKRFPDADICTSSIRELAAFILTLLDAEREWNFRFVAAMQILSGRPNNSEELVGLVVDTLARITKRINRALFHGLLPKLRVEYSLTEMAGFSRGYRRQDCGYDDDFPRMTGDFVELEIDNTESEYNGIGERVELSTFCKYAKPVSRSMECCICVTQFDDTEEAMNELPVITKCGHFYHKACLDRWVNDSAMKSSNTCPSCRAELCEPRGRLHASLEEEQVIEVDHESGSWTAESATIVPSWPRLQRPHARILDHLMIDSDHVSDREVFQIHDSVIPSTDSDGGAAYRRMMEIMRAERRY